MRGKNLLSFNHQVRMLIQVGIILPRVFIFLIYSRVCRFSKCLYYFASITARPCPASSTVNGYAIVWYVTLTLTNLNQDCVFSRTRGSRDSFQFSGRIGSMWVFTHMLLSKDLYRLTDQYTLLFLLPPNRWEIRRVSHTVQKKQGKRSRPSWSTYPKCKLLSFIWILIDWQRTSPRSARKYLDRKWKRPAILIARNDRATASAFIFPFATIIIVVYSRSFPVLNTLNTTSWWGDPLRTLF